MFEGNELIPRTGWLTGGLTDPSLWRAATLSRPLPRPRRIQAESHETNFNDLSTVNVKWSRCMFSKFCSWREHAVNVYYLIINYCLMLTLILYESRGYYDAERAYRTLWKRVIVLKFASYFFFIFYSLKALKAFTLPCISIKKIVSWTSGNYLWTSIQKFYYLILT